MASHQVTLRDFPSSLRDSITQFVTALRRREVRSSYVVARRTAEVLRMMLSSGRYATMADCIHSLHQAGNYLQSSQPSELAIGNIVRRVLYFVREEYVTARRKDETEEELLEVLEKKEDVLLPNLRDLLATQSDETYQDPKISFKRLKGSIMQDINELIEELDTVYQLITSQATAHIHAKEIVMTYGHSTTIVEFLKAAGRKRKFHVIVAESAPSCNGHNAALELGAAGIDTTVISDSAIFAMMSRVNKVIIGAQFVLANGGLVAESGSQLLAQAAQYHSVPVMVCVGLYKLCPLYPQDHQAFDDLNSPAEILKFEEVDRISQGHPAGVAVENPSFDYVPPEMVSLFVTNYGGHNPSYIYRLIAEYYHPSDYSFQID